MLYGVPDAPRGIYRPSFDSITKNDPDGSIIEFPLSVIDLGVTIPISGGFYLRLLPEFFLKKAYHHLNLTRPVLMYIHPHDINKNIPKLNCSPTSKFISYYGREHSLDKLESLFKEFTFKPVREVLHEV
jgi:hypothetical protein